jgi:hypothetical protein
MDVGQAEAGSMEEMLWVKVVRNDYNGVLPRHSESAQCQKLVLMGSSSSQCYPAWSLESKILKAEGPGCMINELRKFT